jgi:hypothetical protein
MIEDVLEDPLYKLLERTEWDFADKKRIHEMIMANKDNLSFDKVSSKERIRRYSINLPIIGLHGVLHSYFQITTCLEENKKPYLKEYKWNLFPLTKESFAVDENFIRF